MDFISLGQSAAYLKVRVTRTRIMGLKNGESTERMEGGGVCLKRETEESVR